MVRYPILYSTDFELTFSLSNHGISNEQINNICCKHILEYKSVLPGMVLRCNTMIWRSLGNLLMKSSSREKTRVGSFHCGQVHRDSKEGSVCRGWEEGTRKSVFSRYRVSVYERKVLKVGALLVGHGECA